jgi:hypothetical protein
MQTHVFGPFDFNICWNVPPESSGLGFVPAPLTQRSHAARIPASVGNTCLHSVIPRFCSPLSLTVVSVVLERLL